MSKIAAALLIAATLASSQAGATEPPRTPKPTAVPTPTPDQKQAADAWVKDAYAWADRLTKLGESLGTTLNNVFDGTQTTAGLKLKLKVATGEMDEKASAFGARPAPTFEEMSAFKAAFLDYLAWERKMMVAWVTDAIRIADDRKLKPEEKAKAASDSLHAQGKDEDARKAKIESAMKAVYAALNRK
jgi:hypothetical protein